MMYSAMSMVYRHIRGYKKTALKRKALEAIVIEKIDNILKSQQALENIKDKCSYCIDNNKDLEYTFRQIQNILLS